MRSSLHAAIILVVYNSLVFPCFCNLQWPDQVTFIKDNDDKSYGFSTTNAELVECTFQEYPGKTEFVHGNEIDLEFSEFLFLTFPSLHFCTFLYYSLYNCYESMSLSIDKLWFGE